LNIHRREGGGNDPRQQHGAADHALEPELLVQQERERDPEHHLERHGDAREDERVLERLTKSVAVPEADEVLDAHEVAGPADERVGQREVERHAERIGHQEQDEDHRRGDEHRPQDVLAVEELAQARPPGQARLVRYREGSDRHGRVTSP
jgi:hypothetical protein